MKACKFERKGKTIRTLVTDKVQVFESINLAKKVSRGLQFTLGDGRLRVV